MKLYLSLDVEAPRELLGLALEEAAEVARTSVGAGQPEVAKALEDLSHEVDVAHEVPGTMALTWTVDAPAGELVDVGEFGRMHELLIKLAASGERITRISMVVHVDDGEPGR